MKPGIVLLITLLISTITHKASAEGTSVVNGASPAPAELQPPIVYINNNPVPNGEFRMNSQHQYLMSLASQIRGAQYFITRDGSAPTLLDGPYNGTYMEVSDGDIIRVVAYDSGYSMHTPEAGPITLKIAPPVLLKITQIGKGTFGMAEQGVPLHAFGYETQILSNNVVSIYPAPAEGWNFVSWSGDVNSNDLVLSMTMDSPKNIVLKYEPTRTPLFIQKVTPTIISVSFQAVRGFTYRILKSTNMKDWTAVRDIPETTGYVSSNFPLDSGGAVWYQLEQTGK